MNSEANKASIKKSFKGSLRVFLHNRSFLIGSIMILVVVISAIFADVIAPYEYDYADMSKKLLMPTFANMFAHFTHFAFLANFSVFFDFAAVCTNVSNSFLNFFNDSISTYFLGSLTPFFKYVIIPFF